jgi:hypothetical protein
LVSSIQAASVLPYGLNLHCIVFISPKWGRICPNGSEIKKFTNVNDLIGDKDLNEQIKPLDPMLKHGDDVWLMKTIATKI